MRFIAGILRCAISRLTDMIGKIERAKVRRCSLCKLVLTVTLDMWYTATADIV